jgi:hypothetical protein
LIAASTGSAAANLELGASTLHSLAMIPVDRQKSVIENPSAKCLQEMQNRFKNVKLLIIDEFSMIGKNLIGKLDIRTTKAGHWKGILIFCFMEILSSSLL